MRVLAALISFGVYRLHTAMTDCARHADDGGPRLPVIIANHIVHKYCRQETSAQAAHWESTVLLVYFSRLHTRNTLRDKSCGQRSRGVWRCLIRSSMLISPRRRTRLTGNATVSISQSGTSCFLVTSRTPERDGLPLEFQRDARCATHADRFYASECAALAASRRAFSFTWVEQQCPISQWNRSLHSCEQ